jgi:leader peptidase (prepilin peptidase) / N-methyltransferase
MNRRALIACAVGTATFASAGIVASAGVLVLARLAIVGGALAACASYDLVQRRIPNRIVIPATAACTALTLAAGRPLILVAGLTTVLLLLVVSLRWPAALGMGDVKLALLLVVGLDGSAPRALALGLVFAALAGLLRVVRDGGTAWRASLPLAPFLAAGALIAVIG